MPRTKFVFPTHFFCHTCKVVVPISYEAAAEGQSTSTTPANTRG